MMPPLPALRCSPGREHITENYHKRSYFEGGLICKTKDDDLVLFNEVKNQERDNFLLHTADDFEDSLSKLRHFSDFKLGINIQTRGEGSDLLKGEGDKSDCDWLLTPPDTPLFPKLDDDDSRPSNLAPKGRTRSHSIPISRSVSDKSFQTSRTSHSPQGLIPSPRSSSTLAQVRGRSSSTTQSSPPPVIRSTISNRSPCSPPNKPSIPTPRSATPTFQRKSTSFSIQASNYGGRGASPVNSSPGNSSLPKFQGWQKTLPGFNSEASPKLQSSLLDPSISYMGVSFPPSRNVRELSMKLGRKSMSPTSSRSISTLHSLEKDRISSYCKTSMEPSGDDDEEPLHSRTVGVSRYPPHRKDGSLANNKAMTFSIKPSRTSPSKPVPKRSFDSAPRLMDQHKTPQSMFRPLLSSVPASTFRPIYSWNSSPTTSSNTSSDQVISSAPDLECNEIEQNDLPGGWARTEEFDTNEEVFLFDKADVIRDARDGAFSRKHQALDEDFSEIFRNKFESEDIQNSIVSIGDAISIQTFESGHCSDNPCFIDTCGSRAVCSKCGKEFSADEMIQIQILCGQCTEVGMCCTAEIAFTSVPFTENVQYHVDTAVDAGSLEVQLNGGVPEFHEDDVREVNSGLHERNTELGTELFSNTFLMQLLDQNESKPFDHQHLDMKKNTEVDVTEGAGISVLLQGSASTKWPILQGKTLSATNILCSELSYSRNNFNASRRSIGVDNASATSSIDLGLVRQTDIFIQHQVSRKDEAFGVNKDTDSMVQSLCSDNDALTNSYEPRIFRNEIDEIFRSSTECLECDSSRDMKMVSEEHTDYLDQSNLNSAPSRTVISKECRSARAENCWTEGIAESQDLNRQENNDLPGSSTEEFMCLEECSSSINTDEYHHDCGNNLRNIERTSDISLCSELVEYYNIANHSSKNVILDTDTYSSSIVTIESQDGYCELADLQNECLPSHDPPSPEYSNEHPISQTSENDISLCSSELITAELENGESAVMVEGPRGRLSTLEEATNTILFCSSIIHDLAYKAATIAMEKEQEVLAEHQAPLPITILEKSLPVIREESVKMSNKHTMPMPRSHKLKQKKFETQPKSPLRELENVNDVNDEEFIVSKEVFPSKLDSPMPPKLESKCNCAVM